MARLTKHASRSLKADAKRYRWLRTYREDVDLTFLDSNEDGPTDVWYAQYGNDLDVEIDDRMDMESSPEAHGEKP